MSRRVGGKGFVARRGLHYAALSVGATIFLLPLLWMAATSLKPTGSIFSIPPKLLHTSTA